MNISRIFESLFKSALIKYKITLAYSGISVMSINQLEVVIRP